MNAPRTLLPVPDPIFLDAVNFDATRDFGPYEVAGIIGSESTSGDALLGTHVLKIKEVEEGVHESRFVITQVAIKKGESGRVQLSGTTLVVLEVDDPEDEDLNFAAIEGGEVHLVAGSSGTAQLISFEETESESDPRLGLIRFPIGGAQGVINNPHDLTYTGEHSEAASTNFYTNNNGDDVMIDLREPPDGTEGFVITQSTGVAYYDAGDSILYGYVADWHYNSIGALLFVEKERRVIIEIPEDCA